MKMRIICLSLAAGLLFPLTALGDMYLGAAIGNTWQSSDVTVDDVTDEIEEISENSTGWKIFGGFKGGSFLGVEGGYRDLGEIETELSDEKFKSSTTGWDVEAIGHIELSIIDLFAKAGAFFWSTEATWADHSGDDSGTAFIWGLGAGISFGSIGVRLEWESLEVESPDNLSMLSLGATLGF